MARQFDLTEKHAIKLLRGMNQLKEDRDLCDFVIKVGSEEFQTHRNILAASSPYFKAILKRGTQESQDGKLELTDADTECVKSCIDCIYSARIRIPQGKTELLLQLIIKWQLDKAKDSVCEYLCDSLNEENIIETCDIAEVFNLQIVSDKCAHYFETNLLTISVQPQFQNVILSTLTYTFKSSNLDLTEKEKLDISLKWVGTSSYRAAGLLELIKLIKLQDVPAEYLADLLEKHPVIENDFSLYKLINASFSKIFIADLDKKRDRIIFFDQYEDCLKSYDPGTGEVINKFRYLFSEFSAVSMDSFIYVLCNKSVHRLNFRKRKSSWELTSTMISDHGKSPPVVSCLGCLFVFGSDDRWINDVEAFDPAIKMWGKLKDKPAYIDVLNLVSSNELIFSIGGRDIDRQASNRLSKFTPKSSTWCPLEPMRKARLSCATVAYDKRIFVIGGMVEVGLFITDVEYYDITSGHWTVLSPTMKADDFVFAHHTEGRIFIFGDGDTEEYNVARDEWCKARNNTVKLHLMRNFVSVKF